MDFKKVNNMSNLLSGSDSLAFFKKSNSLIDSMLSHFEVKKGEYGVIAELVLSLRDSSEFSTAQFVFTDVKMVGFFYSNDYVFYNVENVKFMSSPEGYFYLSLDPDESEQGLSDDDQDFVLAGGLEVIAS